MAVRVEHSMNLKHLSNDVKSSVATADKRCQIAVASMDTLDLHERCERDQALLRSHSPEAQEYRRALLRGRRILIVQGGYIGKAFIYHRLRRLGVHVTVLDSPTSIWAKHDAVDELIAFEPVGEDGEEGDVRRALAAIKGKKFDSVITFWEEAAFVTARLCEELGIDKNPSSASGQARNKCRTRMAMAEAGLPTPRFARINSTEDVAEGAKVVGFPAVLKPAAGSGSTGVITVNTLAEAQAAFKTILRILDAPDCAIETQSREMILEELYVGDECDVDVLLCDGVAVYVKVSDNWGCAPPWFQEVGENCPSLLGQRKQRELETLAVDTLDALGFRSGVFHVEVIYTEAGPRLIEVNARMGGMAVHEANLVAWGVDLVEEHAMLSCGIPIAPLIPEKPLGYFAECLFNAPYSGIMNASNWLDGHALHKVKYFKDIGDKVTGPEDGMPDWIAEARVISEVSMEDACEKLRKFLMELSVPITPSVAGKEKPFFFPHTKHPFVVDRD